MLDLNTTSVHTSTKSQVLYEAIDDPKGSTLFVTEMIRKNTYDGLNIIVSTEVSERVRRRLGSHGMDYPSGPNHWWLRFVAGDDQ